MNVAETENAVTNRIIGCAIEVHRHLGPGLLESAYEECLCYEFGQAGLSFQRQVQLPIFYKGLKLGCAYIMDVVVEDRVIVEIKATDGLASIHIAQLLTYLKNTGKQVGLLISFNVPILKDGLKRVVNRYAGAKPSPKTSADSAHVLDGGAPVNTQKNSALSSRLRVSAVSGMPKPIKGPA